MIFTTTLWLWGLLAVPILALLEARAAKRARKVARLLAGSRDPNGLLAQSLPQDRRLDALLRLGVLAFLVLGAAGPQWGRESVRRQSSGSDLVFVIDVSKSMDARDVAPSRIDEARREALGLLDRVEGSRVAVMAFAGDAVRVCPLTLDHAAARLTIETLSSSTVSMPGTDLGRALHNAVQLLPSGRRDEQAIVVWTDGEDLEGHATQSLAEVKHAGVRVFAVGVGTPAGDVIPVLDEQGRASDVKRDEEGLIVRSRLDEPLLRSLGRSTRGGYFAASRTGGELTHLAAAMGSLARSSRGSRLVERPVSRFSWCAFAAAALLAAALARPRRAAVRAATAGRPAGAAQAAAVAIALLALAPRAQAQSAWAKGDRAFRAGDWVRAETLYAQRAKRGAPAAVGVNLATVRAYTGRRADAERDLSRLTANPGIPGQVAGYNLGTLLGERREYDRALGELRRALERNPDDADARWNYELLKRDRDRQSTSRQPKPQPRPQQPSPGQQGASGPQGANPPPQPQQGQGSGNPPPLSPGSPPQPTPGGAPGMTRQQAEQLLGSLQELERIEKQRARPVHAMQERKGKDW